MKDREGVTVKATSRNIYKENFNEDRPVNLPSINCRHSIVRVGAPKRGRRATSSHKTRMLPVSREDLIVRVGAPKDLF